MDCLGLAKDTPMISSIFYNWDREGIYLLSFGSADKNVEDWCGHPNNPEGIELDHSEMESIASLFLGPSFPVLVTHKKWREDIGYFSYGLEVYHMESYEKEKGRCYKLINNEYVVALFMGGPLREVHLPRKSPIETKANFLAAFCDILQITQSLQTTQSRIKIYSHPEYFNIGTYHGNWDHL